MAGGLIGSGSKWVSLSEHVPIKIHSVSLIWARLRTAPVVADGLARQQVGGISMGEELLQLLRCFGGGQKAGKFGGKRWNFLFTRH